MSVLPPSVRLLGAGGSEPYFGRNGIVRMPDHATGRSSARLFATLVRRVCPQAGRTDPAFRATVLQSQSTNH